MVTPFKKDNSIDYNALTKLTKHLINGNVDFLVVMGTTGENPTLSIKEQDDILSFIIKVSEKKLPIVYGIAGNNTQAVIERIKNTDLTNVAAILSATPYYNKPSQKGLYAHYKAIAEVSPVPIILYNVPGRTSVNLSAKTCLQLANNFKNIIAIKEASANIDQIMQIIKNKPKGFSVLSGDDTYSMPFIAMGMDGVISVTANALPKQFSDMVNASLKHDIKTAQKLHYKLLDFSNSLFLDGNPSGIKAALEILGIMEQNVRLPLQIVNTKVYEIIKNKLIELK